VKKDTKINAFGVGIVVIYRKRAKKKRPKNRDSPCF